LRELLQQMATTAFPTIGPHRAWREVQEDGEAPEPGSDKLDAALRGSCWAVGPRS
jgi:hypothetical protein